MKFVCKNCGYRFSSETEQRDKRCPYCGDRSLTEEQNAEKLLENLD